MYKVIVLTILLFGLNGKLIKNNCNKVLDLQSTHKKYENYGFTYEIFYCINYTDTVCFMIHNTFNHDTYTNINKLLLCYNQTQNIIKPLDEYYENNNPTLHIICTGPYNLRNNEKYYMCNDNTDIYIYNINYQLKKYTKREIDKTGIILLSVLIGGSGIMFIITCIVCFWCQYNN